MLPPAPGEARNCRTWVVWGAGGSSLGFFGFRFIWGLEFLAPGFTVSGSTGFRVVYKASRCLESRVNRYGLRVVVGLG